MKKTKIITLILIILTVLTMIASCAKKDENQNPTSKKQTTKHEHEYVWTVTREATCQQTGSKEGICSDINCRDVKKEPIESLPHTFGENNTEPATCTAFGRVYHVCSVCEEVEEIEQLPLIAHDYTKTADISGKYTLYECSECQTSYVRTTETANDLFYWTCSETPFDSSLATFNEYFGIEESSFDDYTTENGNKIAAMGKFKDDKSCVLYLTDKKGILPTTDFVLQFDIMLENLPQGNTNSLLWLDKGGQHSQVLFIDTNGYLVYESNDWIYGNSGMGRWNNHRLKTDFTFEAGKWYNIAVSFRVTETPLYDSVLNEGKEHSRIPYDIYIDGELIVSYDELKEEVSIPPVDNEDQRIRHLGPTTEFFNDVNKVTIRISDSGYGNGGNECKMAFDNLRIYTGRTVDTNYLKAGTYTFGTKTVIVDMPTIIDWKK